MAYRLPPLGSLRAFEAAARHLSFKHAAEELHVTPAAISQQIKGLEEYLGVSLFVRLTRALAITAQGEAMLPKIRAGFDCLAEAVDSTRAVDAGGLDVTAPPSFATRWLVPRLPAFAAVHPGIRIRLSSSSDSVDRRGKGRRMDGDASDPRAADSALSIRYGTGHYPGFVVERLLAPDWVPVCSPRLPSDDRQLNTPSDLARHVLIHDETVDAEGRQPGWREWLVAAGVSGVDSERGPRFGNAVLAVEAALDRQGVALALKPLVEADLAAGRLIIPFDIAVPSPFAYFLVARKAVAARAPVVAFREWLLAQTAPVNASGTPGADGV